MSSGLEFKVDYKAFEEENMSHDLLLSSRYYVKRNFKENWILLVHQWVFCAFGNFDCAILI